MSAVVQWLVAVAPSQKPPCVAKSEPPWKLTNQIRRQNPAGPEMCPIRQSQNLLGKPDPRKLQSQLWPRVPTQVMSI